MTEGVVFIAACMKVNDIARSNKPIRNKRSTIDSHGRCTSSTRFGAKREQVLLNNMCHKVCIRIAYYIVELVTRFVPWVSIDGPIVEFVVWFQVGFDLNHFIRTITTRS